MAASGRRASSKRLARPAFAVAAPPPPSAQGTFAIHRPFHGESKWLTNW